MKITFLGATQTVTGSKYLIENEDKKILIDCGLFQGHKELRLRNWKKLPINPENIDAVILTHAHIDHSGYIPLLVKQGFKGKIYCSAATYDLCAILLPDSGYLQEEDARRSNKYSYTKHKPALPLYGRHDAIQSLEQFKVVGFNENIDIGGGLSFILRHSGHILGSSFVLLSNTKTTITFSGDLGRLNDPILKPPVKLQYTDYLLIESTYGGRLHDKTDPIEKIGQIVRDAAKIGGTIVIPAFAVGRSQTILYYISELKRLKKIPDIPVFLDSPMAISASDLLCKYKTDHKLSGDLCEDVCSVATYTRDVEDSKKIDASPMPKIIISASGMASGGRILHHLKHFIGDHKNTILFTGFQAGGTRGDRILKGEKEIKIHGKMHPVKARIETITGTSAHADYAEILEWLSNFKQAPKKVFITHGEIEAAKSLKGKIEKQLGWNVVIPEYLQSENL
ncbi:MAG: metallo-beta-lactamase family protein [Lentimonas sp.]|jgi:metallo-beta-lactamase family protein